MKKDTVLRDYHCTITARISADKALDAIADVSGWWAKNFEGRAEKLNDIFTVRFGETFVRFSISELLPSAKVVWKVEDCHLHWIDAKKEWNGSSVIWELSSQGGSTRVDMTHLGLTPEVECYEDCKPGWDGHIKNSLLKLMEEGKGMPE